MRILLISSSYLPISGGLQTAVSNLAGKLFSQGHKVKVVTNRYPRSLSGRGIINGVSVKRLLFLTPKIKYLLERRIDIFAASFYFFPFALFQLTRLMKEFHPEVVNIHFPDAQIPFVLCLRKLFLFRLVVSLHGDEVERWFYKNEEFEKVKRKQMASERKYLQMILQSADKVTACSRHLLNLAIEIEPTVAQKGRVIHNGVDTRRLEEAQAYFHRQTYLLAIGRLVFKKGFDILLEAFSKVKEIYPSLDLIIAGDGKEKENLQKQAQKLGLKQSVHFLGEVSADKASQLLKGCEIVIVPSRYEPFGVVLLEAMACNKPVIAARVGGIPEIIEGGKTGLLVEAENSSALREGIIYLLNDADLRKRLAEAGRKQVFEKFREERVVRDFLEVYKEG